MLTNTELCKTYDINFTQKIGQGSYGSVYQGVDKVLHKDIVVKVQLLSENVSDLKVMFREISILRILKGHPNIVQLQDIFILNNELFLIFENGASDLHKVIYNSPTRFTLEHLQFILYQILKGVNFIHSKDIVHRDLKPSNILINADCTVKICDFGSARSIPNTVVYESPSGMALSSTDSGLFTTYTTTRWYRSPELLVFASCGGKKPSDMWSIGCVFAELILRGPLFPSFSHSNSQYIKKYEKEFELKNYLNLHALELIFNLLGTPIQGDCIWMDNPVFFSYLEKLTPIARMNFAQKFPKTDINALNLLEQLLQFNPSTRYTAATALQHNFFASYASLSDLSNTSCLNSPSIIAQQSAQEYMQFENKLTKEELLTIEEILELIKREAARYIPEDHVPITTDVLPTVPTEATEEQTPPLPTTNTQWSFFSCLKEKSEVSADEHVSKKTKST